jgi:predicted Ser/Thr protein kinase
MTTKVQRFTVIDDFFSDDLQSAYIAGFSYEVDEGNDKLAAHVEKWIKEGKVREGGPVAIVSGSDSTEE